VAADISGEHTAYIFKVEVGGTCWLHL